MIFNNNPILDTDSYKLTHGAMYPDSTRGVYSYLEARIGAEDPEEVFYGLQPILDDLTQRVTLDDVQEAKELANVHLGPGIFNEDGWLRVVYKYGGKLPLKIKAAPEGTIIPAGNVMMTVENTDPDLFWLTNAVESLLLHVWYPITVATRSRTVKTMLYAKLLEAGHGDEEIKGALPFMLHDFGFRGTSSKQSAAIGGSAHLVNFMGTDTLPALTFARDNYEAKLETLGFSVPATEHSVMTSLGKIGEQSLVGNLLYDYPTGVLSLVGDSYDIFRFATTLGTVFKERVLAREGKVVVRPDSGDPISQVPEILNILWDCFGGTTLGTGLRVLDPHIGVLWGDGLDGPEEIVRIVDAIMAAGFSPINLVFGMGGGLLQKVNRDTERFAFKCSAQKRNGVWLPIQKNPLDQSKASKPGRLELIHNEQYDTYDTRPEGEWIDNDETSLLETVFENGEVVKRYTFDEIRERAAR